MGLSPGTPCSLSLATSTTAAASRMTTTGAKGTVCVGRRLQQVVSHPQGVLSPDTGFSVWAHGHTVLERTHVYKSVV